MNGQGASAVRVLVVDDQRDSLHVLGMLLKTLGCTVTTCQVASECVGCAEAIRPQLILLDIAMPQLNGFDVAIELRKANLPPFFLVALSGYGASTIVERCIAAGFDRYLLKPVSIEELREVIQSARQATALAEDPGKGAIPEPFHRTTATGR